MTDIEYDIIDELYFVTPYSELKDQTGLEGDELKDNLSHLIQEGLVRIYKSMDQEIEFSQIDFENSYEKYFYLATKKGLFEHNRR